MLNWRTHPTLAAGIALPLLLGTWLAITNTIPRLAITPPKYDVLYLTNYVPTGSNVLHFEVVDAHAVANFIGENFGYGWPQLFRFHVSTGKVEEIRIPRPNDLPIKSPYNRPGQDAANEPSHPVAVPALAELHLDSSPVAPDGYVFRIGDNTSNNPTLWEGDNDGFAYVFSSAKQIAIPQPAGKGKPTPVFLGWVLP